MSSSSSTDLQDQTRRSTRLQISWKVSTRIVLQTCLQEKTRIILRRTSLRSLISWFMEMWIWPSIEKNIINPAEIWITLRLPTRVLPSNPTFSLQNCKKSLWDKLVPTNWRKWFEIIHTSSTYIETLEPLSVPNKPFKRIPMPCQPIPRLRTWGGGGVALASRAAALKAPVD